MAILLLIIMTKIKLMIIFIKNHLWNRSRARLSLSLSLSAEVEFCQNCSQYLSFQTTSKRKLRKEQTIFSKWHRVLRHLLQFSNWRCRLGILDDDTQLNTLKIKQKQNQKLMNETNALWKDFELYWLNLMKNSNQKKLRQT